MGAQDGLDGKILYKTSHVNTMVSKADYSFKVGSEVVLQESEEKYAGEDVTMRRSGVQLILTSSESGNILFDRFVVCQENL